MGIEANNEPFKTEKDKYGKPLFVSEVNDTATGVIRRVEKSIFSKQGGILFSQTDTIPALGLARTMVRTSNLPEEGLSSKHPFGDLEEEITITETENRSQMFAIFATQYVEGERIKVESLYAKKVLWDDIECEVFYNEGGKISEIFVGTRPEVVKEGEEFNIVKISWLEDIPYFEVIDINKPVGRDIKESTKKIELYQINFHRSENSLKVSEVFGSQDFSCTLEDSKDRVLLRIEHKNSEAGRRTISLSKSVDVDELYDIAATDGFAGWEKALEKVNAFFFLIS